MTYIGSVKDAEKAMSDDKRVEQERIQGFCPEGVEDFAERWFGAIEPVMTGVPLSPPAMTSAAARIEDHLIANGHDIARMDDMARDCADAFRMFADKMHAQTTMPTLMEAMEQQTAALAKMTPDELLPFNPRLPPYLAVPRVSPEAQRIAALEAELAAARADLAAAADQARELTGQKPEPAQHPLKRAVAAWPGYGWIDQLTGKPRWV